AGLGEERPQDVERTLHRAGGDQHLGDEEVAALEARTHLLERRDQRVVEHLLGLDVLLEPGVRQVFHLGRVADERVVVQPLEDLLFGHAAPFVWSRWPRRRASWFASSISRGASCAMRSPFKRAVGPEIESAAIASPAGPSTGAASAVRPISSSSIDVAKPRARIAASSGDGVLKARNTFPLAAASKGTFRPTQSVTPTKWAVSSCARCSTPSTPGTARLIVSPETSASRRSDGAASSTSVDEPSRFA